MTGPSDARKRTIDAQARRIEGELRDHKTEWFNLDIEAADLIAAQRDEIERLRAALETLAEWNAAKAADHQHFGFREYARAELEACRD